MNGSALGILAILYAAVVVYVVNRNRSQFGN